MCVFGWSISIIYDAPFLNGISVDEVTLVDLEGRFEKRDGKILQIIIIQIQIMKHSEYLMVITKFLLLFQCR